nr:hypothetical protein [Tanacetum cinerariifolium]
MNSGIESSLRLDHPVQNEESPENFFEEKCCLKNQSRTTTRFSIHQLIEECSIEVHEEQKQKMEDTMFDLFRICHHKQFLYIHDDVNNLIESALESKLLLINSINSQRLDKNEQEVKNVEEKPAERRNHAESECEVTLEDKRECDELVCKNPSTIDVCDNHSKIFSNSNNDDDISINDNAFEDIEYIEALLFDHEIIKVDLFLSDNSIPPGIENVADDPEGDIRFLEELLINDSILSHESSDSNFEDNPSNLRPPPEPPDDNSNLEHEVISAVMEDIDEPDEHFNPGGEIFVSTKNEDRVRIRFLILSSVSLFVLVYVVIFKWDYPRRLKISYVGYCPGFQDLHLNIGDNV